MEEVFELDEKADLPAASRANLKRVCAERLGYCEEQMRKGAKMTRDNLCEIHRTRCYRFVASSFREYCDKRLGITEQRGVQIIQAGNGERLLAEVLGESAVGLPESVLREGARADDVEAAAEAIRAGGKTKDMLVRMKKAREPKEPDQDPKIIDVEIEEEEIKTCHACGQTIKRDE